MVTEEELVHQCALLSLVLHVYSCHKLYHPLTEAQIAVTAVIIILLLTEYSSVSKTLYTSEEKPAGCELPAE